MVRHFVTQLETILRCRRVEEVHLAPDVVQCSDQKIQYTVKRMELGVVHRRQAYLCQQCSDELNVCARVVTVLHEPL